MIDESISKRGLDFRDAVEKIDSKSAISNPKDESARREYSPVTPSGITSQRYEEMKDPKQS